MKKLVVKILERFMVITTITAIISTNSIVNKINVYAESNNKSHGSIIGNNDSFPGTPNYEIEKYFERIKSSKSFTMEMKIDNELILQTYYEENFGLLEVGKTILFTTPKGITYEIVQGSDGKAELEKIDDISIKELEVKFLLESAFEGPKDKKLGRLLDVLPPSKKYSSVFKSFKPLSEKEIIKIIPGLPIGDLILNDKDLVSVEIKINEKDDSSEFVFLNQNNKRKKTFIIKDVNNTILPENIVNSETGEYIKDKDQNGNMNSTTTNNGNKINDTKSDELIINPLQLFSDAIKTIHNANSFTVMRLSNGMFPVQEFYVKGEGMMQRNRGTTYFTDIEGNYYDVYIEGGKIKLHESMISPQKNPFEDFKNELSTPIDMSANNLLDYQIEGEKIIIINKLPLSKKDFQRIYPRKFNEIYWAEVQDGINIKIEGSIIFSM